MNRSTSSEPISAASVADKLAWLRKWDAATAAVFAEIEAEPRLREALWFLQWVSHPENYAGGLNRFTADLIDASRDLIGTNRMLETRGDDNLSAADAEIIECEMPEHVAARCLRHSREEFQTVCMEAAREKLHIYLARLCSIPAVGFRRPIDRSPDDNGHEDAPWYFPAVAQALLSFMSQWRAQKQAAIADTALTRDVFTWLTRAAQMPAGLKLEGDSRFGKSEAARAWCEANPGLARFAVTPSSNCEVGLLRAIAESLGISGARAFNVQRLRELIGDVLNASPLMLVFDEAHFLIGSGSNAATQPRRLNWVRLEILDRGLPVAFVVTAQSYRTARAKFVKRTGYAFEQFEKRLISVSLPALADDELLSIARRHFPGVADIDIQYAATASSLGERTFASGLSRATWRRSARSPRSSPAKPAAASRAWKTSKRRSNTSCPAKSPKPSREAPPRSQNRPSAEALKCLFRSDFHSPPQPTPRESQ